MNLRVVSRHTTALSSRSGGVLRLGLRPAWLVAQAVQFDVLRTERSKVFQVEGVETVNSAPHLKIWRS